VFLHAAPQVHPEHADDDLGDPETEAALRELLGAP
jgi:hypothetical protein